MAETKQTRAKTAAKPKEEKSYTEKQVQELIAKAVNEALSKMAVKTEETDSVTVLFLAEVSPENVFVIPGYGSLRPNSYLDVPKREFGGKFMTPLVRKLIHKRHLIVLNGLTEDERKRYDCDYKEGEVLSEKAFDHLLDYEPQELGEIFKRLCPEHKKFVCRRIITAFENNDWRLNVEKVKTINDISKSDDPEGMLKPLMKAYGEKLL